MPLAAQLTAERRNLANLVRAGGDTADSRRRIAGLEREVATEQTQARERHAEAERQQQVFRRQHINDLAGSRWRAVLQKGAEITLSHDGGSDPVAEMKPAHRQLVAAMIGAEDVLRRAERDSRNCVTEAADLQGRLDDLAARREEIAARRARGDLRSHDGGDLELIRLDAETLEPMHLVASTAAEDARRAVDAAVLAIQRAEVNLVSIETLAGASLLVKAAIGGAVYAAQVAGLLANSAGQLDAAGADAVLPSMVIAADAMGEALLTTINQIDTMKRQLGRSGLPPWGPSKGLWLAIQRLAFQRNVA